MEYIIFIVIGVSLILLTEFIMFSLICDRDTILSKLLGLDIEDNRGNRK